MRHRWFATVLGCSAMLALAACAAPGGADGKLIDDWAELAEPKVSAPVTGTCYPSSSSNAFRLDASDLATADSCTVAHAVEIVHVGEVTGADANGTSVPGPDGAAGKAAYADCTAKVRDFLGDDWQAARLHLVVWFPSDPQWAAGARFFHCDLVEIADEAGKVVSRQASLRDGLRGAKPLALGCVNDIGDDEDSVDAIDFVACAAKHTAEFSGVFTVTPARSYPGDDEVAKVILDGCEGLAGKYLGVAGDNIPDGLGWFTLGTSEDDWGQGNQSVRCYVGVFDRSRPIRAGATIKGLGSKPIPR